MPYEAIAQVNGRNLWTGGLSTDSKPTDSRVEWLDELIDHNGDKWDYRGPDHGWKQTDSNGSLTVIDHAIRPKTSHIPKVAGVDKSQQVIQAATSNTVVGLRATVNAGSDAAAAYNLKNNKDCVTITGLDQLLSALADTAIITVHIVGLASTTNAGGNCVAYDGSAVEADYLAAIVRFVFLSTDNVRFLNMSLSKGISSDLISLFEIKGYSL